MPNNSDHHLPYNSDHPRHVFEGIVLGELHRLNVTCANKSDYNFQVNFFSDKLRVEGYPEQLLFKRAQKKQFNSSIH